MKMNRHLEKKNLLILLIVVSSIIAVIFIPYWVGHFSYNHTPLQTQVFGTYEQIKEPAGDYYWIKNGAYTPVVGDYWLSGFLLILVIVFVGGIVFLLGCLFYVLFDWLFPKNETHTPYTPDKDIE